MAAYFAAAGTAAALNINSVSAASPVNVTLPTGLTPSPWTEVPPWFVKSDVYHYFLATNDTYECLSGDALVSGGIDCSQSTALVTEDEASAHPKQDEIPPGTDYKRDYEGVYTAQLLKNGAGVPYIVGLDHAENKNDNRTGGPAGSGCDPGTQSHCYHNTVEPSDSTCWTPVSDLTVWECYPDYNGFVDESYAPLGAGNGLTGWRDSGPIVWPKAGYTTTSGAKASWGVRHPSSIVADGFIYVFYLDTGDSRTNQAGLPTQGAGAGIAVARAPAVLSGSSQSFETYAGDGHWESSLPRGFASADAPAFFSRPGPTAAQILGSQRGSYYFAVARTGEAHPAYIGVEDYSEASSPSCAAGEFAHKEALWESDDLVSWRDRTDISQLTSCGATAGDAYNRAPLRWAHFLNADGSDQNTVDPSAFDLIGTCGACGNTGVGLVRLTISP